MLENISVKGRLYLFSGVTTLMLLIVGFFGINSILNTLKDNDDIYIGGEDNLYDLSLINRGIFVDIFKPLLKIPTDKNQWPSLALDIQKAREDFNSTLDKYLKAPVSTEDIAAKNKELERLGLQYNETLKSLQAIIQSQNGEQLANFMRSELWLSLDPFIKQAWQLMDISEEETANDYNNNIIDGRHMIMLMIIIMAIAVILSLLIAKLIIDSIAKPLRSTVAAIDKVAMGDTTMELSVVGDNELSRLTGAMQKMIASTSDMNDILAGVANGDLTLTVPIRSAKDSFGKALSHMVERLKQVITEIQAEVSALTSSTQEIVTSVTQVSSGTAETAAAVTETTTTVEELKQTAHVSAEKAKDVLRNVEETLGVVKNSEKTLQLTIAEMHEIQEKMRFISESIVKLSEHSLTIGEIINTVNNLAEQSNLLAVNAAIEAAKAGDQGKSFGVVAQEIRTLAEQSKEATVQVRAILNDIQNATNAAVLATEQGSKAVNKGVTQSTQLSDAIQLLSQSISSVAQAASQIAISSQQQLVGVDQVTVAMTNINEASNQHVEHMHQIETAVGTLNDVAISLKDLVNQYKISELNGDKETKAAGWFLKHHMNEEQMQLTSGRTKQ